MENPLSKVLTSAPPPPAAAVKIRTMRSDVESMMRSGGGAPSFQNVAVSGLTLEREGHRAPVAERTPMPAPSSYSVRETPHGAGSGTSPAQATGFSSPPASPPEQEFVPGDASKNHLTPVLIVTLVAIIAIAVVGYFAYSLFLK